MIVLEPAELSEAQKAILRAWEGIKNKKVAYIASADDIKGIVAASSVKVTGASKSPLTPLYERGELNIWVLPRLRPNSPLVCHILNRNYDAEKGSVTSVKNVEIVLSAPLAGNQFFRGLGDCSQKVSSCKLISPDRDPIQLNAELKDDGLHIPIPDLGIWSLLVIQ